MKDFEFPGIFERPRATQATRRAAERGPGAAGRSVARSAWIG